MFNKRNRKSTKQKTVASKEEEILDVYEDVDEYTTDDEEEEYQEFKDVGVLEEKRYKRSKRIINIFFTIIMIILVLAVIDIVAVEKYDKGPFFAIPLVQYKDGGTKEYYGLGYKVIKYHQLQGRRDKEIGFWTLKYNTNPITVKDIDLAIDFTDNKIASYEKYYKKFVRIISTLHEVDKDKHQITIGYIDEDGKYTLDMICQVSEDQNNLSTFEEGKEITIIGTIRNYKNKTAKANSRLYLSDCFAEQ